jgi:ankyrin repeat protein
MHERACECLLLEASEGGDLLKARNAVRGAAGSLNLNCRNEAGDVPLILAARGGHIDLVQFLLDEGADVHAVNESGDTALISASESPSNTAVLKLLLERGAGIDCKNDLNRTALVEAASIGDLQNVTLLLQHNPDLNVVTREEETALTFAVVYGHLDIMKALVDAGADVNWRDTKGWSPLTYAVFGSNAEMERCLLDAGASPSEPYEVPEK